MNKIQESIDIRILKLFITVMESDSLTEAADKLAVNQSTISHALERLRQAFNDPLVIRSGRSVKPTDHALELLPKIKRLLSDFAQMLEKPSFIPKNTDFHYNVAASDFQCEKLLPSLVSKLLPQVKSLQLNIVPACLPNTRILRNEDIDLMISPVVPDGGDIMQRKLYELHLACYYDPKVREAPTNLQDFIDADYVCPDFLLDYEAVNLTQNDNEPVWLRDKTQIVTSSYSSSVHFVRSSRTLTIAPKLLAKSVFRKLAHTRLPYPDKVGVYLIWNKRSQKDPKHSWFREQLAQVALDSVGEDSLFWV